MNLAELMREYRDMSYADPRRARVQAEVLYRLSLYPQGVVCDGLVWRAVVDRGGTLRVTPYGMPVHASEIGVADAAVFDLIPPIDEEPSLKRAADAVVTLFQTPAGYDVDPPAGYDDDPPAAAVAAHAALLDLLDEEVA